jgi:polygalacturonase
MNCTGFTLDGPVLRDSGLWGVVVANSRKVALRNTKHFNRLDMGENDCVDICNSQDVTVERSIGISLDDPYSTKTWASHIDIAKQWSGSYLPNRNVVFDDCLSWTRCFAFKIGAGVWQDQENITVRNSVVYDSAHAIGISHSYGSADVRNVTFDGIDVERNTMTNLGRSWARVVIDPRKPDGGDGGSVYDVRVRNVTVRDAGTDAVPVVGLSESKSIRGLTFENITMPNRKAPAATLADVGVVETKFADGIAVDHRGMGASPMQPAAPAALRSSLEGTNAAGRRERMGEAPMPQEQSSRALGTRTRIRPGEVSHVEGTLLSLERAL